MIFLYTNRKKIRNGRKIVANHAKFYSTRIKIEDLDGVVIDWIFEIDHGIVIDGEIKTPFGLASLEDLSLGLKTLINIHYCIKNNLIYNFDVTSCGANALNLLFKYIETLEDRKDSNIKFVLRHCDVEGIEGFSYEINNKIQVHKNISLMVELMSLLGA